MLSGDAKLEGVRWVLLSAAPRKALRNQLKALLFDPNLLGPCRLRRARFKPGRKLTAHYDVLVGTEGAEGYRVRPISVVWRLDERGSQGAVDDALAAIQVEALRCGVAQPFRELIANGAEWDIQLHVSPLDMRFPQLVRLSDRRYVRSMLAAVCDKCDGAQGQWPAASDCTVTSIRYHPGKRHVLRYDALDGARRVSVFAKLYPGEEGEHASGVAVQVANWLQEHGNGMNAVRPLAYVTKDRVVLYPQVGGAPLSELLRRPDQVVGRCLEGAGAALRVLHKLPPQPPGPLEFHDFSAEVHKAAGASDHVPALLPSAGAEIIALLDRAQEMHVRLPQELPTFTHGDFKSEHVWTNLGQITLMDFDGQRLADPAYDIGRFLADLQLWYLVHNQSGLPQAQERFLAGYAPGVPEERLARARLYEVTQLIKIARRLPLGDNDWSSRTERLIGRAQALMNELEARAGLPTGRRASSQVSHNESEPPRKDGFARKLAQALSGDAKLEGVRWMLLSATPRRVLRDQLKAMLRAPEQLGSCHLLRAKFKPGRKLTTYHEALVQDQGGGYSPRHIAVVWRQDGDPGQGNAEQDAAEMQDEAVRRGVAAPFRKLSTHCAKWGMHLQVSPLDVEFPQLAKLSDPQYVRTLLASAYAKGNGARSQGSCASAYAVTTIRYRPGQRHVLCYRPLDAANGRAVFAKIYADEQGAHASRVAGRAADWLEEHCGGATALRPLAHVAEDGVVLYPQILGASLHTRLKRPSAGMADCVKRVGAALQVLHHLPPAAGERKKIHDFSAEVGQTKRASDYIRVLLPSVGAAIGALLERASELYERLPQESPTFTHGDFKSDHVWATPRGLTFIDFDTSHLADPALDVGKFLAHLTLQYITGKRAGLEQVREKFLRGYSPGAPPERLVRACLCEVIELIKITARRVCLFDSNWRPLTEGLIRRAQTMMKPFEICCGFSKTRAIHPHSRQRNAASNKRPPQVSGRGSQMLREGLHE